MPKTVLEIVVPGLPVDRKEFSKTCIMIGRAKENDIIIMDPRVSRNAGFISPSRTDHHLRSFTDTDATNPTYLFRAGQQPVQIGRKEEVVIGANDYLLVGQVAKIKILAYEN